MQKQQDMGKAHWLFKPTLVEGTSLWCPGTSEPQKQGSSAQTLSLHSPQMAQLNSTCGRQ